jgi:hypothetical protein
MALQVRGRDILTHGEFHELVQGLEREGPTEGVLQAWFLGEDVDPARLHETLDIEARLNAKTPTAERVIERALTRLEDLYPEELPSHA